MSRSHLSGARWSSPWLVTCHHADHTLTDHFIISSPIFCVQIISHLRIENILHRMMAPHGWVIVAAIVSDIVSHLDIHIIDIIMIVTANIITELETFLLLQMILLLLFIMIQLGLC